MGTRPVASSAFLSNSLSFLRCASIPSLALAAILHNASPYTPVPVRESPFTHCCHQVSKHQHEHHVAQSMWQFNFPCSNDQQISFLGQKQPTNQKTTVVTNIVSNNTGKTEWNGHIVGIAIWNSIWLQIGHKISSVNVWLNNVQKTDCGTDTTASLAQFQHSAPD